MTSTYELVTDPEVLAQMVAALAKESAVALDTEASSFHRYHERVCLLQLSSPSATWLVDPLAIEDLSSLGPMVCEPHTEVVIHDADYDLRMLKKAFGWRAANVFDTLVAAELLNEPELGLAALLRKYERVEVDKRFQKADWSRRPLSAEMLVYAARDTQHLLSLRTKLQQKLMALGRWAWAQEEFRLLVDIPFDTEPNDEPGFLRIKRAKTLKPRQLAILSSLFHWREGVAQRLDRAPFMVLGNESLLDLATNPPTTLAELGERNGVGASVLARSGKAILAALEKGAAVPKEEWPRVERHKRHDRDAEYEDRLKRLKNLRDRLAKDRNLAPGVLCSNGLLAAIARERPRTEEELNSIIGLRRWQAQELGAELLAAI
jgi:ribonuclease D